MKIQKDLLRNLPDFQAERTKNITTLVLTLVTLSIFGLFAISPTLSTIANLQKQLDDSNLVHKKLEEKIANLELLNRQYNLIEKDLPLILTAVPQTPETARLVGQLRAIAVSSSVEIDRAQVFQVEISQEKIKNPSFVFSLVVKGTSDKIADFLRLLSDFDRIVTIDIISQNLQGENGLTQLELRGKAYYEK